MGSNALMAFFFKGREHSEDITWSLFLMNMKEPPLLLNAPTYKIIELKALSNHIKLARNLTQRLNYGLLSPQRT